MTNGTNQGERPAGSDSAYQNGSGKTRPNLPHPKGKGVKTMLRKTWNVRDQTEKDLKLEAERLYREIENGYKLVKKVSEKEEAEKIIDRIWIMKSWANDIQIELIRREYSNEA